MLRSLALVLLLTGFTHAAEVTSPPGEVTLNLEPTRENPRNSEGSFATLASGRVLFCYSQFRGGTDDASPARIVGIHSDDEGQTWSEPVPMIEPNGGLNVMSVSLLRLASGKLAMFYCVKQSWLDCRPHVRISSDEGATWTEPKLMLQAPGYFVMNNDRVIQTRTGRLIVPLAFHRARGSDPKSALSWDSRAITMWLLSDDEGATWRESGTWWALPEPTRSGLQEPGVVEREDGTLFSWSRTDHGEQWAFESTDSGQNWTPPIPTELKSPNGPASIKRLPHSDKLLALFDDHSGRFPFPPGSKRTPYVAAISGDGGKTWPHRGVVESDPDGAFHYTAIHFVGDSVLLAYSAGDSKAGALSRLRIRRISREWFDQL